jgi:hypothetical protein
MFCDLSNYLHIIAGMKDEVPLQHGLMVYRRLWGWAPYCLNLYEWRWVVGSALQLFLRAVVSINYAARWSLDNNFEFPSRSPSLCSTRSLWFYWIEVRTDKVGGSSECLNTNLTRLQMVYRVMWNPGFTSRLVLYFRVPYDCAVLPHEKSTAFPFFNSVYFAFHRSNTRSPRTYGYGDSQIKCKNNLHTYKLYC